MKLFSIRMYDHAGRSNGYLIGPHGPYVASKGSLPKLEAVRDEEAKKNPTVNYVIEEIKD